MPYPAPPSSGSKLRDSALVAERLSTWGTKLVCLPFAGLGKELCAYEGSARLLLSDSDPSCQAWWLAADRGKLEEAAVLARHWWHRYLEAEALREQGGPLAVDRVQRAWKSLCASEREFAARGEHAAWAMATFAGARNGGRRRNKKGQYNWPYAPKSLGVRDPE